MTFNVFLFFSFLFFSFLFFSFLFFSFLFFSFLFFSFLFFSFFFLLFCFIVFSWSDPDPKGINHSTPALNYTISSTRPFAPYLFIDLLSKNEFVWAKTFNLVPVLQKLTLVCCCCCIMYVCCWWWCLFERVKIINLSLNHKF